MTEIVQVDRNGQAVTTTVAIAGGTATQHKNVIAMVRTYQDDLKEFGIVAFETRKITAGPGRPESFAYLNEDQAMLLLAYMANTTIVRAFKKALIHAFRELLNLLNAPPPTPDRETVIALGMAAAQEALGEAVLALEQSRKYVRELEPVARSFVELVDAEGDYLVREAAKILSRSPGIKIGQDQLFVYMRGLHWIFRNGRGDWEPYQVQVNLGRLVERIPPGTFRNPHTGEERTYDPQMRVTKKGINDLRDLLTRNETRPD